MTLKSNITSPLIKYVYKVLTAILIIYISYASLVTQDINPIWGMLFYFLSAFLFWLLLNYAWRAISRKIYDSLDLVRSIDQFCFITTFGVVCVSMLMVIVYNVILILLPDKIAAFLTYTLLAIFELLEILFSYTLGRAFFDLKVLSKRQRWFCWAIGSFFIIVYPILLVSGTLIPVFFGNTYNFYNNYSWLAYILFGLENYVLIFVLLCIKFF